MSPDDPGDQGASDVVAGQIGAVTGDDDGGAGAGARNGSGPVRGGGNGDGTGDGPGGGGAADGRAAVAVDPRMRSRRIRVRRAEGRRRLRRVTLVLAAVAAVVLAAVATRTPLLDVDHVRVGGVAGERSDEVVAAASVAADQPLVSLDGGAVADRIEELPWVESAQVSRSWPATVRIEVTPRSVVAAVQVTGDHIALVDAEGVVVSIERGATRPEGDEQPDGGAGEGSDEGAGEGAGGGAGAGAPERTLVLTGISGRIAEGEPLDEGAQDAITVASAVAEHLPDTVASVSTDLDAELPQGGVVRFGSTEDLDEKITAVKTVLSEVDTTCMALLDVRVPGSPALTRNQGCS